MSLCPAPHLLCAVDEASQLLSPSFGISKPLFAAISWPFSFLCPAPPALSSSLLHHTSTLPGTQPCSHILFNPQYSFLSGHSRFSGAEGEILSLSLCNSIT